MGNFSVYCIMKSKSNVVTIHINSIEDLPEKDQKILKGLSKEDRKLILELKDICSDADITLNPPGGSGSWSDIFECVQKHALIQGKKFTEEEIEVVIVKEDVLKALGEV